MRVRFGQFTPEWARLGHETRELRWAPSSSVDVAGLSVRALRLARWADVLVLCKPRMPPAVIGMLARVNRHVVVDTDDAIWAWNAESGRRFRHAIGRAGLVIVGSDALAEQVRAMAPAGPVTCVRPAVDVAAYRPHEHTPGERVVVGWIGGPGSLADFTDAAAGGLAQLVDGGAAELRIVCSEPLVRDGLRSSFVPWALATEAAEVGAFTIGVMPLRDDAAARGRCGLKAIQYMAAGIPVVASPVGVASELVEDGRTGFLVETAAEWADALGKLAADPDLRAAMGHRARERAGAELDRDPVARRLARLFDPWGAGGGVAEGVRR